MTWIKKYPNLMFFIALTFFTVVVVESFLRVSGIGYGNSPIEMDQQLHHRLKYLELHGLLLLLETSSLVMLKELMVHYGRGDKIVLDN